MNPKQGKLKEIMFKHIIVKLLKIKDKEKCPKIIQRKITLPIREHQFERFLIRNQRS